MKLTIEPNENLDIKGKRLIGGHYRYKLTENGVTIDVTNSLQRLSLNMASRDINEATITFGLDGVNIDAEVLAQLKAEMERQGETEIEEEDNADEHDGQPQPPNGDDQSDA